MRSYQYPAEFTPAEEGGFVITFPDVPEAITQAETITCCIEARRSRTRAAKQQRNSAALRVARLIPRASCACCSRAASDALEEAIIGRINTGRELPVPSTPRSGQYSIPLPAQSAFKAALYEEIRSLGLNKVELAARLGVDEKEVRRLLDPHHPSKLPRIAEILGRVGKRIVVGVEDEREMAACG